MICHYGHPVTRIPDEDVWKWSCNVCMDVYTDANVRTNPPDDTLLADILEFITYAEHDAGCVGGVPTYRCKCGLRDLRFRLGVKPEPSWPDDQAQPAKEES